MARQGDGIYRRGRTWWLDAIIGGQRYQLPLGKLIPRSTALEIATAKRAEILKGGAGIAKKKRDIPFTKAAEDFTAWARANKRPKTADGYESCLVPLLAFFGDKTLGQIHPFLIEKYKQKRLAEGVKVGVNRELSRLHTLFNLAIRWKKYEGENPA
jgi:hypothetical protein